jgi:HEAT repeat protein
MTGRNLDDDPAAAARRRAAEAGHTGDEPTARALLVHDDADVRATALGALRRMEALADDDVRWALADSSPMVRRRALACAAGRPELVEEVVPLLLDADASVAEQAAWALGEAEDPATVDALVASATHDDALVREAAVAALGALQDERGLPAILAGTEDKPAVRRRAVLALAGFDGPEVEAALARAVEDRDWQVRDAAQLILDGSGGAPEGAP